MNTYFNLFETRKYFLNPNLFNWNILEKIDFWGLKYKFKISLWWKCHANSDVYGPNVSLPEDYFSLSKYFMVWSWTPELVIKTDSVTSSNTYLNNFEI